MSARCVVDWPAWINAITVVVLAAITAWYAVTTRAMLREIRAERLERLRELRRPVMTVLDEIERRFTEAKALLTADAFDSTMDDVSPAWGHLYERLPDVADSYRARSERVYIELWKLRPAMQPVRDRIAAVVGGLRTRQDREAEKVMLARELTAVGDAIAATRHALEVVV